MYRRAGNPDNVIVEVKTVDGALLGQKITGSEVV
jgi:hypothetical protein